MHRHLGKDYPYKARFQSFAKAIPGSEENKRLAVASLKDLVNIFNKEDIAQKVRDNPQLLFWASNLILLGFANLNGDAIRKEDGFKLAPRFQFGFCDLEHNREDVVGAIYAAGYSLFGSNKVIDEAFARETEAPVQLVIGGYLWRTIVGALCDYIEQASLESSSSYGDVSTSFELLFDGYEVAVANGTNPAIEDARIIDPASAEFKTYKACLKCNDGTGYDKEGNLVFRILGGDIVPVGAGLVTKPASGLKGVLAIPTVEIPAEATQPVAAVETNSPLFVDILELIAEAGKQTAESIQAMNEALVIATESQEKNIKSETLCVSAITIPIEPMKLTSLKELGEKWADVRKLETAASIVELAEASSREQIADAIAKKSEEWAADQAKAAELHKTVEANRVAAEAKAAEAVAKSADLERELVTIRTEMSNLRAAQASALAEEKFGKRMEALNDEFNLDDDDRAILGEEVQLIPADSEEAFAKFFDKKKKLLREKSKKGGKPAIPVKPAKADDDDPDADAKAKLAQAALASVVETPNQETPPNSSTAETVSLRDQFKAAFGAGTTVNGVLAKDLKQKDL